MRSAPVHLALLALPTVLYIIVAGYLRRTTRSENVPPYVARQVLTARDSIPFRYAVATLLLGVVLAAFKMHAESTAGGLSTAVVFISIAQIVTFIFFVVSAVIYITVSGIFILRLSGITDRQLVQALRTLNLAHGLPSDESFSKMKGIHAGAPLEITFARTSTRGAAAVNNGTPVVTFALGKKAGVEEAKALFDAVIAFVHQRFNEGIWTIDDAMLDAHANRAAFPLFVFAGVIVIFYLYHT